MASIYRFRQWSLTLLRITLGFIFVYHGYLKLFVPGGFKGMVAFFTAIGIPLPLYSALLVSIVEFVVGIFLISGFLAKWTSMLLIINMLVALFKVHLKNGFLIVNGGFEFVAALIIALLVILLNGPGSLSLDRVVFGSEEETEEEPESKKSPGRKSRKSAKVRDFEGNGVVSPLGITREEGYLYFVDKSGDVARVRMARRGQKINRKHELIAKLGIKRKEGYLYYLDRNGDVSQSRMARGQ